MKEVFKVVDKEGKEVDGIFHLSIYGELYTFCDMTGELINVSEQYEYFWLGKGE